VTYPNCSFVVDSDLEIQIIQLNIKDLLMHA